MRYERQTLVRELYENSPIAHDLLNRLAKLGQKKYGFCENEMIKNLTVEQISQMIAHLVDESEFDKLLEIADQSPLEFGKVQMPQRTDAVFCECSIEAAEQYFSEAGRLGINRVVVPWKLSESETACQKLIQSAHGAGVKLLVKLDLHSGAGKAKLDWSDSAVRTEVYHDLKKLIQQGCDGFCLENADLLAFDGREELLFASETEIYLREIMEQVIAPAGAELIGRTYFDGLAAAASRTGADSVLHFSAGYLLFDGMDENDTETVDLNDYKNWLQERNKDIPTYWPLLSTETAAGISLSRLAERDSKLEKKAAELLLLIQCMFRGTPYLLQQDIEGHERFVQKLLKLRNANPALTEGSLELQNERLYDLMTFVRNGQDGTQFYVECNLSSNTNVLPYDRPQHAEKIISNYEGDTDVLRPYEAAVYRICPETA